MELRRGKVADLTPIQGKETATCKVGDRDVYIHRDLVSSLANGDEVIMGGPVQKNVLQALSLKNFDKRKVTHIELAPYILGLGLGGFIFLLCLILAVQNLVSGNSTQETIAAVFSAVGLGIVVLVARRMLQINQVFKWVKKVES